MHTATGRKFTALLLVMALFVAMAPMTAMAGPASSPGKAATKTMSMSCDQVPTKGGQMPCSDPCGCCLGMLGCVAPVASPQLAALPVEFQHQAMSWSPEHDPGGRSTHPPYRPPIA